MRGMATNSASSANTMERRREYASDTIHPADEPVVDPGYGGVARTGEVVMDPDQNWRHDVTGVPREPTYRTDLADPKEPSLAEERFWNQAEQAPVVPHGQGVGAPNREAVGLRTFMAMKGHPVMSTLQDIVDARDAWARSPLRRK